MLSSLLLHSVRPLYHVFKMSGRTIGFDYIVVQSTVTGNRHVMNIDYYFI